MEVRDFFNLVLALSRPRRIWCLLAWALCRLLWLVLALSRPLCAWWQLAWALGRLLWAVLALCRPMVLNVVKGVLSRPVVECAALALCRPWPMGRCRNHRLRSQWRSCDSASWRRRRRASSGRPRNSRVRKSKGRLGRTTRLRVAQRLRRDWCRLCRPCRGPQLQRHWLCSQLDTSCLRIRLDGIKLDMMGFNEEHRLLVKGMEWCGVNLFLRRQWIPLDFMVERGHLMDIFKLAVFMEVLDRWCTRKVMRLVCIVVVRFPVAGTQWALWHPLEEGASTQMWGPAQ